MKTLKLLTNFNNVSFGNLSTMLYNVNVTEINKEKFNK